VALSQRDASQISETGRGAAGSMQHSFDIAVIGAGIAGASVAAELADDARVALIEMEAQPGYHTTGRSAAVFAPIYGPAPIRALTRASEAFFTSPPRGFAAAPLVSPRGILMIARADQEASLDALLSEVGGAASVSRLDEPAVLSVNPLVRPGYAKWAMQDSNGQDIDVAALHQGYLKRFKALGGTVMTRREVMGLDRTGAKWTVHLRDTSLAADIVVNAAGAWADHVAALAGIPPVGLTPKRRTAAIIAAPQDMATDGLPITIDIDESFYLKPDAGRLLISPADETPTAPCDAQPEEFDIALCVDRIETAFDLSVRRIENKWAGLRSFVADKCPVAGYAGNDTGFFWLAGQGGYGIQSAPALARTAAALVMRRPLPPDIADEGVRAEDLSPARLAVPA